VREGERSSQRTAGPLVSVYLWSPDGMGQHAQLVEKWEFPAVLQAGKQAGEFCKQS
jgi:hypothetical protein